MPPITIGVSTPNISVSLVLITVPSRQFWVATARSNLDIKTSVRQSCPEGALSRRVAGPCASASLAVADRHAGAHVLLNAVLRERIAEAVLGERAHAFERLQQLVGRKRHQHLVVVDAAVAPLGKAGN